MRMTVKRKGDSLGKDLLHLLDWEVGLLVLVVGFGIGLPGPELQSQTVDSNT